MSAFAFPSKLQAVTAQLNKVSGDLRTVQRKITDLVADKDIEALCRELGVRSAGFLFLDVHERVLRFVARMRDDPELLAATNVSRSVKTPYYWASGQSAKYEKLIDSLFVLVREWQVSEDVQWAENERDCQVDTEYLSYLPSVSASELMTARAKEMDVHYCQVGDLWLTIFVWRMLCCARDAGLGESAIHSIDEGLLDLPLDTKECRWRGHNLLEPSLAIELPALGELAGLWKDVACVGSTWRLELAELLRDDAPNGEKRSWREHAAVDVARRIGALRDEEVSTNSFAATLIAVAPKFVRSFVSNEADTCDVQTVNELIGVVERRARFPILPFFLWNVVEQGPITYLVAPVWTSQQYPVKVLDSDCQHIGLALCAVDPIPEFESRDLDTVIPRGMSKHREPPAAVLVSLLRVIARPLVEGSLYASAVTAARNDHAFLKKADAEKDSAFDTHQA